MWKLIFQNNIRNKTLIITVNSFFLSRTEAYVAMARVYWNLEAVLRTFGNVTIRARNYLDTHSEEQFDHFCNITLVEQDADTVFVTYLTMIISIVIVVVGIAGNSINIWISSGSLRKNSSSCYIFLLAISDSMFLIDQFLGFHLPLLKCFHFKDSNLDFVNNHEILCKFWCYFMDLFHEYSTALILAFTIERFIAVYRPMRVRQICTLNRTRIVCLLLFIVIAVCVAPYHFIMINLEENVCRVLLKWEKKWYIVYTIETFALRILPVLAIAFLNICIIHKIREKQTIVQENDETRKDQSRQMTIILLLISVGHVILYLPVAFHYLLWMLNKEQLVHLSDKGMTISRSCVETLDMAGCAENFFLYTLGSKIFRQELKEKICCRKRK